MDNSKYLKTVIIDKLIENKAVEFEDVTIDEVRLNLYLNGEKTISMMCIPKDQDAHAIGYLMSENVISSYKDIKEISVSKDGLRVDVNANINQESIQNLFKEKTLTSGCGGGVTGNVAGFLEIPFNQSAFKIKAQTILDEIKIFYKDSELYNLTGCVHKAMIYLLDGTTVTAEDIGRHNAIDKAIGKCMMQGLDTTKSVLFVSGRLSSEMVTKAVMHAIPMIVSRTAPTYLGVQTAQKHGITMIGFARCKKMNMYTHQGRIDV